MVNVYLATKCASVNTNLQMSVFICYIERLLDERHFNFCTRLALAHVILMSYLISTQGQAFLE